jgi:hypothetical protein
MLTKCPECNKQVPADAETCPHCGHRLKKPTQSITGVLAPEHERFIQPDYTKWQAIRLGMTPQQVVSFLGEPLEDDSIQSENETHWVYGYLELLDGPDISYPRAYVFHITFYKERVTGKADPFLGCFSEDGRPTRPIIVSPVGNPRYSHYPRVLDVRCQPCSGVYPITYSFEMGWCQSSSVFGGSYHDELYESGLTRPGFAVCFNGGAQKGRCRMKAHNALGESEWSDYCHFRFSR